MTSFVRARHTRSARYKWYALGLLFCNAALNYADRTSITAVFPLLRREFHMSDVALAAIGSLFLWSYAAASPFAGFLADRLSRSKLIFWSLLAWSVVTGLTGLVTGASQLLAMRVLLGLSECLYLPAAIALIADYHSFRTRATAISIHSAGLQFGMVAGASMAGYLGDHFGWRAPFFVLGTAGITLAVASRLLLTDDSWEWEQEPRIDASPPAAVSISQSISKLVRIPTYMILLCECMLAAVGSWIFYNWLPLYLKETFEMTLAGAGFSGTFFLQAPTMIGIVAGGYPSDLVARRQAHHRMLLFSFLCLVCAPFLLSFVLSKNFTLIGICIFSFSLLRSLGQANAQPILCDLLSPRLRSTAVGLMNTANCLAGGIGILVAGYLKADFGLAGVFAGVSLIQVIAAILLLGGYIWFAKEDLYESRTTSLNVVRKSSGVSQPIG